MEENHSIAWEMLKLFKAVIIGLSIISIIELGIIGYMGYLLYDSQFEYVETNSQEVEDVNNSNISQK